MHKHCGILLKTKILWFHRVLLDANILSHVQSFNDVILLCLIILR